MTKFLTGNDLHDSVYDIIFEAKKHLLIISPFIRLDDYFKNLFNKYKSQSNVMIIIAFGKNEENVSRSFSSEDFSYFKEFPNISIVYIPNLHAKYYANERRGIITSINLYDYSFKNNIEFGVLCETAIIGGDKIDREAWEKSMKILGENNVVFVRKPKFKKKLFGKDYIGSETLYDVTEELINKGYTPKKSVFDFNNPESIRAEANTARISREEFEAQRNYIDDTSDSLSKIGNNISFRGEKIGYCIRCSNQILLNPKSPYCKKCYKLWKIESDKNYIEQYCHACGEEQRSSFTKPMCRKCYYEHKEMFDDSLN